MRSRMTVLGLLAGCAVAEAQEQPGAAGQPEKPLPTVAEKTEGMSRQEGLLTFHGDAKGGTVWLELPPPAEPDGEIGRFLLVDSIRGGLGSNPVGIDRGQLGESRVVRLRRVGPQVVLEQLNLGYRALSGDAAERAAVLESFASSILWGETIGALDPDGRALVDLQGFLVRDAHDVRGTLREAEQGEAALDPERSVIEVGDCLAFPDNLEFEATLTYSVEHPGEHLRATLPAPDTVTLVQRHSLIRLPDAGYRPRRFDPRVASLPVTFLDFSAPLSRPVETRWILRHRLEPLAPGTTPSPVREPLVYHVDSGAPEPIRSALLEGASWWAAAFEAAGLEDAFRVEVLPEGVHPLDVRYHVIQWVHRSTRGWSYGGSIHDPRTGEILKGHVSLGSLRVRQDRLLFEGLLGTEQTGTGAPDDPVELALARIRQLAAHEVGHTLGFTHNFAASTYDGRASVMDYPAPLLRLREDGSLDCSAAYGAGIGSWDRLCVRYAYQEFGDAAAEEQGLAAILAEAVAEHRFLADADARPAGAAHPWANLWDNGADPVAELANTLAIRRVAIDRFDASRVAGGTPLALLEEVFAPVYFHHRYQLEAAVKSVGGVQYAYAVRGDGRAPLAPVDPEAQRAAVAAVLACLSPAMLDVPDAVIENLVPRPFGYGGSREQFAGHTDPVWDPVAAAAAAADLALSALLQPERCARVEQQGRRDPRQVSLEWLLEEATAAALRGFTEAGSPRHQEIAHAVLEVLADRLLDLAHSERAGTAVRAVAEWQLAVVARRLDDVARSGSDSAAAAVGVLADRIRRYLAREVSAPLDRVASPAPPPGDPIGADPGACSVFAGD